MAHCDTLFLALKWSLFVALEGQWVLVCCWCLSLFYTVIGSLYLLPFVKHTFISPIVRVNFYLVIFTEHISSRYAVADAYYSSTIMF